VNEGTEQNDGQTEGFQRLMLTQGGPHIKQATTTLFYRRYAVRMSSTNYTYNEAVSFSTAGNSLER